MLYDDTAWAESENVRDNFLDRIRKNDTLLTIGHFIAKKNPGGVPTTVNQPVIGSFNVTIRVDFRAGPSLLIRIPLPGCTMFPEEKTRAEVATMEYLRNHTDIKIPLTQSYGTREECPLNLGPFIIMEYAPNSGTMGKAIGKPTANGARFMLNPDVNEDKLYRAYSQMAEILLQISKLEFFKIGSLVDRGDKQWDIAGRPITYNMNEIVQLGSLPRSKLPHGTFDTSSSFLEACAKLHYDHFEHQRNDALTSEADGEEKYTRRQLFRQYLQNRTSSTSPHDSSPFKLWCDDLRPSNVLVDDNCSVVSVIDWEFTYAAPSEFSKAPPWWLILAEPEKHESGVDAWAEEYDSRLKIFLAALREQEAGMIAKGTLRRDQILSNGMGKS